ncbi:MAG: terminase family protein [Candidatus Bathyarchaeia archaeon]
MRKLKNELERLERELESLNSPQKIEIPEDPVEFCRSWLAYEPYRYMWPFLRDPSHFIALVQARQTGKTYNGMAKLLWYGLRHPNSLILITAPKFDQVKNIAFKALTEHLRRMKQARPELYQAHFGDRNILRTIIRFKNGSQILAESPIPETIRGHTAKVVYLMEANFIREDEELYTALLFTLNTTNGYLIAESTPWNTDSIFYKMFHDPNFSRFSRHKVVYTEALAPNGPLSPDIVEQIRAQLSGDPARWRREMLCEWAEDLNVWLPTSLITLAQDSALDYYDAKDQVQGEFYIGVDFGKHTDHSVVAVVERLGDHLYLRHCHQFPLETSYGAVIGYIKRLQDNWDMVYEIYADKTGVGDYIVEDMQRGGLRNVTGISFTMESKEQMAVALKEQMRRAICPICGWEGYIDTLEGEWRSTCPRGCRAEGGVEVKLRPLLHIPYDPDLFHELNAERYELAKTGRIHFSHPEGSHDDRFWALALAVYAAGRQAGPMQAETGRVPRG